MDSKGQFSFDLVVAVLLFIVAVSVIVSMTKVFEESQSIISLQNQERAIGESIASKLSQAKTLEGADTAEINFAIPYLLLAGNQQQDCNIKVNKKEQTALEEIALSLTVDYENSIEESKSHCPKPQVKVFFNGNQSNGITLEFDLLDEGILQRKVGLFPASSNYDIVTIDFGVNSTDCYLPSQYGTNVYIKKLEIGGQVYNFPMNIGGVSRDWIVGEGARADNLGWIVFNLNLPNCNSAGGNICANDETCPGDWIASSNSGRCCNMPCSKFGEIQVESISLEQLSKRTSASVPFDASMLPDHPGTLQFSCGNSVKCTLASGAWNCTRT